MRNKLPLAALPLFVLAACDAGVPAPTAEYRVYDEPVKPVAESYGGYSGRADYKAVATTDGAMFFLSEGKCDADGAIAEALQKCAQSGGNPKCRLRALGPMDVTNFTDKTLDTVKQEYTRRIEAAGTLDDSCPRP